MKHLSHGGQETVVFGIHLLVLFLNRIINIYQKTNIKEQKHRDEFEAIDIVQVRDEIMYRWCKWRDLAHLRYTSETKLTDIMKAWL